MPGDRLQTHPPTADPAAVPPRTAGSLRLGRRSQGARQAPRPAPGNRKPPKRALPLAVGKLLHSFRQHRASPALGGRRGLERLHLFRLKSTARDVLPDPEAHVQVALDFSPCRYSPDSVPEESFSSAAPLREELRRHYVRSIFALAADPPLVDAEKGLAGMALACSSGQASNTHCLAVIAVSLGRICSLLPGLVKGDPDAIADCLRAVEFHQDLISAAYHEPSSQGVPLQ